VLSGDERYLLDQSQIGDACRLWAYPLCGVYVALYYLALAFLITHELDAVTHSEWRLLFVLRDLEEAIAAQAFVALHVPLLFAVLWYSHHTRRKIGYWTRVGVAAFLIVHMLVHFSLSGAPQYDFDGILSRILILSSGTFAGFYLISQWRSREANGEREV